MNNYLTEYIMKDISIEEINVFITNFQPGDIEKFYTLFNSYSLFLGVNPRDDLSLFIYKLSKESYNYKYMYQIEIEIYNCLQLNTIEYERIQPELYFDCFVWCLIVSNIPKSVWSDVELMTTGATGSDAINTTWMTRICKRYDLAIKIYVYDEKLDRLDALNTENHSWYGDGDKAKYKVKMCFYEGHWFVYEKLNISQFALEHIDEIRMNPNTFYWNEDDLFRVVAIKNGKPIVNKDIKISSLKLMVVLKKNNLIEPILRDDKDFVTVRKARGLMFMTPEQRKKYHLDEQK